MRARAALLLVLALLHGCIYLPRSTEVYDSRCQILFKKMELEEARVGTAARCGDAGCLALLIGAGAVTAASAVVSGSIVVAGNFIYWLEKQGQCKRAT